MAFAILTVLIGVTARAQSSSTASDELNLFVGYQLPSGTEGISEILPVFGFRYEIATAKVGFIDLGLMNTHASGVDFSTFEFGLRGTIPMSAGLDAVFYGGGDLNYYKPETQENRKFEFGYHAGVGAMLAVTDNLWLRTDLKFMLTPGTNLYMLFGFAFRTAGL